MQLSGKGQSSLEYLIIVGLTMLILVPSTYLFFQYSSDSTNRIADAQLTRIGLLLVDTAAQVYFSGRDSKIVVEFSIPETVSSVSIIDNHELVFNVTGSTGEFELVFFSDVNITSGTCIGNICSFDELATAGNQKVRVQSIQNGKQVLFSKV